MKSEVSSEDYQNIVYKVGKEAFPNDLRQWFISLYQILFGSDSGPRLGSFFNVYGRNNVLFLLEETIKWNYIITTLLKAFLFNWIVTLSSINFINLLTL